MKKKFHDAFRGLFLGFTDRSVRIQWILAFLALIAGVILKLSIPEWITVTLCISIVIVTEMINTCIERVCDMYTQEQDERVRYIKDLAAGAVLVSAIASLVVAIMILSQHIGG